MPFEKGACAVVLSLSSRRDGDLYSPGLSDGLELGAVNKQKMYWCSPYYLAAIYVLNIHSFSSIAGPAAKSEDQMKAAEPEHAKKPAKEPRFIKEASLITTEEFESVPA